MDPSGAGHWDPPRVDGAALGPPQSATRETEDSTLEWGPEPVAVPAIAHCDKERNQKIRNCPRSARGWRRVVLHFTPSWFSVTMGTGIVSILLHNLPYNANWLHWISVVIFALNVFLFSAFLILTVMRYLLYPTVWRAMIRHPAQSLFLGTLPMGLATIISMIVFVCVPAWGTWAVHLAWGLWWFDSVVALCTCFYLPFAIMYFHKVQLSSMTAAWLLPIVAPIVAAATGAVVAEQLPNPQHALWTVTACYVLWGTGVPLAMVVLVIYFQRLAVHNIPPREVIVSVFLPLGPLGQGGFGLMQLGKVALELFPKTHTLDAVDGRAGEVLYVVGWLMALIMWGFGLVWLFFAISSISRSRFPFNMGWWGFTFPLGVYAVSTTTIGKEMPSKFFSVLGTIFSILVVLLWIMVSIGTIHKAIFGNLIFSPCVTDLQEEQKRDESVQEVSNVSQPGMDV